MRTPITALFLLLTGCNTGSQIAPQTPLVPVSLARFASCAELRDYVTEAWTDELVGSRYGGYYGWAEDGAQSGGDSGSGGGGPTDYSETNVQEVGVDEPDLVKTDGEHLFIAHGRVLDVLTSWPADQTALLSRVEVEGTPFALFLREGHALVYSNVYQYDYNYDYGTTRPDSGESGDVEGWYSDNGSGTVPEWNDGDDNSYRYSTRLTVVDVSDATNPVITRTVDLEGWYTDARMIEGDVYTVTNTWQNMPYELWDLVWNDSTLPDISWDASDEDRDAAAEEVKAKIEPIVAAVVDGLSLASLLPEKAIDGGDPELLLYCTDVYHPAEDSSPAVLTVTHFDMDQADTSEVSATGLMSDGWEVYASADHLYVAQSSWWWWWGWGDSTLETHVHRFDLAGADTIYSASGTVPGWVLSSYSMSEYEDSLRIATTDWGWWEETEETPANRVVVLQANGDELQTVGEVKGIAPGEQIYAARFMGPVGYLVTYQQIDPLFTLDLADPTAPAVMGELEVSGYSSYLHPVGDDHLLAVGMEVGEDGWTSDFAVSLFDISDLSNPTLADRMTVQSDDWSYSESLWDPHAFTFYKDTLAVPLYTWDYDDGDGSWEEFSGLWVSAVDTDAGTLTEIGRVDHDDIVTDTTCPTEDWYDDCYDWGYAWMRRSVVIEDWLYSVSNVGVKVTVLTDPTDEVAAVAFYPAE